MMEDNICKSSSTALEESSSSSNSLAESCQSDRSPLKKSRQISDCIYKKIATVAKHLKATDQNLNLMERLLEDRKRVKRRQSASVTKSEFCSNNIPPLDMKQQRGRGVDGIYNVSENGEASESSVRERDRARSMDSLRAAGTSKSSTVEQLDRLTQSMQDLYRHQLELHESNMRNSRCGSADVVRELSNTFKKNVDEEYSTRALAQHLQDIKEEIRVGNLRCATSLAAESLQKDINSVKRQIEDMKSQCHHEGFSGEHPRNIDKKILEVGRTLEQLEYQQRTLIRTIESLHNFHLHQKQDNEHVTTLVKDLNNKIVRDDIDKKLLAHEEEKIAIKKLAHRWKSKCSDLSAECKAYHEINREKERQFNFMSQERTEMGAKLEEINEHLATTVNKLHLKELEVEREKLVYESAVQEWKTFYEDSQKMMKDANTVIEKLQKDNDKVSKENTELAHNKGVIHEELKQLHQVVKSLQAEVSNCTVREQSLLTTLSEEKCKHDKLSLMVENLKQQLLLVKDSTATKMNKKKEHVRENEQGNNKMDFDRVVIENMRLQKKCEKLVKSYSLKNENIREKDERIANLNDQLQKINSSMRAMEYEFREILMGIGSDVDRTVQVLTLHTNSYYQAFGPLQGVNFHTKVHLVEIKAKLRWLQDEIRSTVIEKQNNLEKPSSTTEPLRPLQKSVHNPIVTPQETKLPFTSTPYRNENIPQLQMKFSAITDPPYLNHHAPLKLSGINLSELDQTSSQCSNS